MLSIVTVELPLLTVTSAFVNAVGFVTVIFFSPVCLAVNSTAEGEAVTAGFVDTSGASVVSGAFVLAVSVVPG